MSPLDRPYVILGGNGTSIFTAPYAFSSDHGMTWRIDSVTLDTGVFNKTLRLITVLPSGTAIGVVSAGSFLGTCVPIMGSLQARKVDAFEHLTSHSIAYPNPATTKLYVESLVYDEPVSLFDILGHEVLRGKLDGAGHAQFDVSALPRGVYGVIIKHNGIPLPIGKVAVVGR
jgi:hypothetical protein